MALDEPRDDDTRTTIEEFSFLLSRQDAMMLPPGSELRLEYSDSRWGGGFYVATNYSSSC